MTTLPNDRVKNSSTSSKNAKLLQKQYEKQKRRKIPAGTLPSAALDIPLDQYTSFVACLKSSKRVLALLGAGLSASSGIPTFRGVGGIWRDHDATKLATPEAFGEDPNLVWQFHEYRRQTALKAKPNRGHMALAKLAAKKNFLAINQNIDVPDDVSPSDIRNSAAAIPAQTLPQCPQCFSLLRPAVVWFGEQIPSTARSRIHQWLDLGPVDLMLVVGTSATVWPAVFYIHSARLSGARVAVFNTEEPDVEVDDPSLRLTEKDWFFKGDAAATLPDLFKEVVGRISEIKD
ncbi:MAG: hypothetical protein Q9220_000382 [cf. Caloplaca sp. 1 TL-2023]